MIIDTYQSGAVMRILQSGKIYRASPSISFKKEYAELIDMLDLHCECPIFGVVRGRKQNTGGRVSGAVRIRLNVPREYVKLTEYTDWADFLDNFKYTNPNDYSTIIVGSLDVKSSDHLRVVESLKHQRHLFQYKMPQAILEYIDPKWVVRYKVITNTREQEDRKEHRLNFFRW